MKIIIAAGGTGGHFYPGLAVARELIAGGDEVLFLVRKGDKVIPLLEREALTFQQISAAGFQKRFHPKNIFALLKLVLGFFQSYRFLSAHRPDLLLTMGGYLSVPPALAARLLSIPVVLHEQNVKPGLANKLLGRLARRVAVSFAESRLYFGNAAVFTGNPLREEILSLPTQEGARTSLRLQPSLKTLLIFGGSLGAHGLNRIIVDSLSRMPERTMLFQVLHLTGEADEEWVRKAYQEKRINALVASYCHSMGEAYAAADFVICRSGASTITELIAVRKPAMLIPYPWATNDHQMANAIILAEVGAAKVFQERSARVEDVALFLRGVIDDSALISRMAENFNRLAESPSFNAAVRIARLVREIVTAAG